MKLVLFTPVIKSSAIARMACLITKKLVAEGHDITIVRTESEDYFEYPIHDFGSDIISWLQTEEIYSLAQTADALIYQIGNHYLFHKGCIYWLPQLSGIVCLHDVYLADLFFVWAQDNLKEAKSILHTWYGPLVSNQFFNHQTSESFIEESYYKAPMTEWICSMAHAVITHSSWNIERILNACPGSVLTLPLPYISTVEVKKERPPLFSKKEKTVRLLTIGQVNVNKRAHSVIQAIGQKKLLQEKIVYQLAGYITDDTKVKLLMLAEKFQVKLVISGELSDIELAEAISQADLISCLRWPAFETASASAIEAMMSSKPTIVTNTGFYQEIPSQCTVKIDPEKEIQEIETVLCKFLLDSAFFHEIGLQGYRWAVQHFIADNYVPKLIEVIPSMLRTKITLQAFQFFADLLHKWEADKNDLIDEDSLIKPLSIFTLA